MSFHAGTVALVGRPNAGKSSLLNALVGERIAAVSRRAQTTRNQIMGVFTTDTLQAVLIDTPGLHPAWTPLNQEMVATTDRALADVDVVTWIVDATSLANIAPILDMGLKAVAERLVGKKVVVALNKVDLVEKSLLLPMIALFSDRGFSDPAFLGGGAVVPVSAKTGEGKSALEAEWARLLPEQPALYPADHLTDIPEKFIVAELVREQVFELTQEEVPYATAVEIERFDEASRELGKITIYARIIVEKDSQKGILIGAGGQMIKKIGTRARGRIQKVLGCKVDLKLFVAVEKDWSQNPRLLKELGYRG